ncbi:hypothetical protein SAMN03159335_06308 [Burkholderia cepacia]|uniref:hypothetical protein n=1 Tax=Burkholderia cepacia complex TaxID=87882 RepID=UPI0008ACD863|nr:hypothetical protein [Burkholderia cepacia]SEU40438.1 hypothetical protein SAMN03159335_06308 [Burkholderia cepacia]HDR9068252.1 hypothetical protein [Burkholderia vietnamiensis]
MNAPIKPKLKPRPEQPLSTQPTPVIKPSAIARVVVSELERGETEGLNHLATLGGLGLLAEIAHFGEHIAGSSQTVVSDHTAKAIDPRNQIDPRKRFIPR